MKNLIRRTYQSVFSEATRTILYKKRLKLSAWLGAKLPQFILAETETSQYERLRDEYITINSKLKILRKRYDNLRIDPGFFLIEGAYINSNKVLDCFKKSDLPKQSVIFAHEPRLSGLAGLSLGKLFSQNCRLILDNVEYPEISGRSSVNLSSLAYDNQTAIDIFNAWNIAVINKYHTLFTTSIGQKKCLKKLGATVQMQLLMNSRLPSDYKVNMDIRKDCLCKQSDILTLYCNNVYKNAGAEETIIALSQLPKKYKLCFLGEVYVDKAGLDNLILRMGVSERVFFRKPVEPKNLISYSSGADLAIIPLLPIVKNHTECLPNRVFESIAAENPILAYAKSEIGRFINKEKIGITFESFDPKVMAAAIKQASNKDRHTDLMKSVLNAKKSLTWHSEEKKLIKAISGVKNKKALVVACKKIYRNDRIYRVIDTLNRQGFDVNVISFGLPHKDLHHPDANYFVAN